MRFVLMSFAAAALIAGCSSETGPEKDPEGSQTFTNPGTDTGEESEENDLAGDDITNAYVVDPYSWYYYLEHIEIGEDAIFPAGDRDFYAIDSPAGTNWSIYTSSYYLAGYQVILDTVLRVYDEQGNLLVSNDDMPYRFQETDSGLYYNHDYDGTFYVEVLEWGDWVGETANGGPEYEYELFAALIPPLEVEPNDTFEDADALQADIDAEVDGYMWLNPYTTYALEFYGDLSIDGDRDIYPYKTDNDAESDGAVVQFSLWPEGYGDLSPTLRLYDAFGDLLAETDDPAVGTDYPFFWDAGISYRVLPDTQYYIEVVDEGGGTGFYPAVTVSYLPADIYSGAQFIGFEIEDNNKIGDATSLSMTESTVTAGYYYTRMAGYLGSGDAADVLEILSSDVGTTSGKYVSVTVHAEKAGSLLDAKVKITTADGTEVASATVGLDGSADPEIVDAAIAGDEDLYFHIEQDVGGTGATDQQSSWFALITVSPTPG